MLRFDRARAARRAGAAWPDAIGRVLVEKDISTALTAMPRLAETLWSRSALPALRIEREYPGLR